MINTSITEFGAHEEHDRSTGAGVEPATDKAVGALSIFPRLYPEHNKKKHLIDAPKSLLLFC